MNIQSVAPILHWFICWLICVSICVSIAVSLLFPQCSQGWCYLIVYRSFKVFPYCFLLRTRLRIYLRVACPLPCPSTCPENFQSKPEIYWTIISWDGFSLSRLLSLDLSRIAPYSNRKRQRIANRFELIHFSSSRLLGSVRFMLLRKYKPVAE